jgi:hypothetical protein
MTIIGHKLVGFTPFYFVNDAKDIAKSPVVFAFDETNFAEFCRACKEKEVIFGVKTDSVKDAIIANAAGAAYIIVKKRRLAKKIQRIAEHYLFDAKILLAVRREDEIEISADDGIDGVIFPEGVEGGNI